MKNFISKRLQKIEPSPTLEITALANRLKSEGKDIIGFGAGEPDFDTPNHIKEAAKKALDEGFTKYAPVAGLNSLREAVCHKFKKDNGLLFSPNQIIIGTGGKQVLYNFFMAVLDAGDEVIIPAPYWVSYKDIVSLSEGKAKIINTSYEQKFKITPEQLEKSINEKTKVFIMNSPSNPTGCVYSKEELEKIAAVLEKYKNILIVTDDIYESLIYDNLSFFNLPMVSENLLERTVIINGLSKTYSMTGWRLGYGASQRVEIIKAMDTLQGQSTSNAVTFAQKGGEVALISSQDCVEEMKKAFVERRNYMVEELNKLKGIKTHKPEGAFYVFPNFSELIESRGFKRLLNENREEESKSKILTKILIEKYQTAIVPGVAFGYDNGFRMSYACSLENIKKGLERIHSFVDDMHK
ncbi:MAG: pyridoxal phosphate-dependent aminotransferase [Spirochaetia bacterium]|nr:pyridoxal phosphate-dependent aminotransferase [Spirochaetia bacterium]